MSGYKLAPRAEQDLREIVAWYRKNRGPTAARKTNRDIRTKVDLLARNPGVGRAREEFAPGDIRFFPHRQFVIAFRSETRPLEVLRIWDLRRGIPEVL
jgi:plasmid stabilization system protein ParE